MWWAVVVLLPLLLCACGRDAMPMPYGYFRIDIPEAVYVRVDTLGAYSMEVNRLCSADASDRTWATDNDDWVNITYPTLNATVHIGYKRISRATFRTVSEECRELAYKHTIRADAISENYYADDTLGVYGIFYEMEGNAASQAQFFMTDSTSNFIRGSLYFNNTPNADSIAPVAQYIQNDMIHMVETLRWKK